MKKGHRIAQLILERCETPDVKEVSEMYETFRGGFGSTGLTAKSMEMHVQAGLIVKDQPKS